MMIYGWDNPYNMIRDEIQQIEYEGKVIPEDLIVDFRKLNAQTDRYNEEKLEPLFLRLQESENFLQKDDWQFDEPHDLESIKKCRSAAAEPIKTNLFHEDLLDKLHGAWTGRACGCALGKPVEIIGMYNGGRKKIKEKLQKAGDWPLVDYFSENLFDAENFDMICEQSWRENISHMEPDDDIHYTLIGLSVLEKFGSDFTWRDVADTWNNVLPFGAICTAETQAILNYNMKTHWLERRESPISPDFTSVYNNPYREWIGAQIRADGWAYCTAGNPERAADFAWRDAHWTHRANGIYGEMFAAAMIAAAFVENDPIRLIKTGMGQIPIKSRLHSALDEALEWMKVCPDWESFMDRVDRQYSQMSSVHTVNNALICAMSIYYGNMDPDRSVSIAVMAGLDTDCNGATVGSITGASGGMSSFGSSYAPKLNDTIKPLVFGFRKISMKELAMRTLKVWKSTNPI